MIATVPHYPTSAELAAFRRSLGRARGLSMIGDANDFGTGPGHDETMTPESGHRWYFWPGGAWDHERTAGIGTTVMDPDRSDAVMNGIARREAAAMRSRAFDHHDAGAYTAGFGHPVLSGSWGIERLDGCPVWDW